MSRWFTVLGTSAVLMFVSGIAHPQADRRGLTLAVTMTNDPSTNQIKVYDAESHVLLQTLSTRGRGGVGGNARGVRQLGGELFAAVNSGSGTVAVFQRDGNRLKFDKLVTTTSAPVSIDFANDHMYVAGATTVDSFTVHRNSVDWMDGTTALELADGTTPPCQVGTSPARTPTGCAGMPRRKPPTRRRSWWIKNGVVTFAEISQTHGDRVTVDAVLTAVARMGATTRATVKPVCRRRLTGGIDSIRRRE
jgi:hypothetical protein